MANVRSKLIDAGVRNLKEFDYPNVTAENILTDSIFAQFFRSMLVDNFGLGYDTEVSALLTELDTEPR